MLSLQTVSRQEAEIALLVASRADLRFRKRSAGGRKGCAQGVMPHKRNHTIWTTKQRGQQRQHYATTKRNKGITMTRGKQREEEQKGEETQRMVNKQLEYEREHQQKQPTRIYLGKRCLHMLAPCSCQKNSVSFLHTSTL